MNLNVTFSAEFRTTIELEPGQTVREAVAYIDRQTIKKASYVAESIKVLTVQDEKGNKLDEDFAEETDLLIWTEAYSPFIMGGNVHAPIGCWARIGPADIVKLSDKVSVVEIISQNGDKCVAEMSSGGLVGKALADVRRDFAEADPAVVDKQLAAANVRKAVVRVLTPHEFWSRYRA